MRRIKSRDHVDGTNSSGHSVQIVEAASRIDPHDGGAVAASSREIMVSPRTRTSMLVRRKQWSASSGVQTTGSFSLKEVLSTMGTPVMWRKASIRRQ